jgi:hypothetical protein
MPNIHGNTTKMIRRLNVKKRPTARAKSSAVEQLAAKLLELLEGANQAKPLLISGARVRVSPGTP